jgi:hypothetical protein
LSEAGIVTLPYLDNLDRAAGELVTLMAPAAEAGLRRGIAGAGGVAGLIRIGSFPSRIAAVFACNLELTP